MKKGKENTESRDHHKTKGLVSLLTTIFLQLGSGNAPNQSLTQLVEGQKEKTYNTKDSLVVTDPTTNSALARLTRESGRDPVFSSGNGRMYHVLAVKLLMKPAVNTCSAAIAGGQPTV